MSVGGHARSGSGHDFVVTISFLTLLHAITPRGVFFLFAFLCLVSLVYFAKRVPETKQRSLQEIEQDLGAQMSAEGALAPTAGPGLAGAGTQRSDQ